MSHGLQSWKMSFALEILPSPMLSPISTSLETGNDSDNDNEKVPGRA